jgi:ribosomal protein S18 acetylase RimI-like enzyme
MEPLSSNRARASGRARRDIASISEIRIAEAASQEDYEAARTLFEEYARGLGGDLCFQGFAEELERLPSMYGPPRGGLLIAWQGARAVGCVALRPRETDTCEMKRLYVSPEARSRGLGRALAEAILERGRSAGYRTIVLDTLATMVQARSLYRSLGFVERAPYYASHPNSMPGVSFMELRLRETPCTATP